MNGDYIKMYLDGRFGDDPDIIALEKEFHELNDKMAADLGKWLDTETAKRVIAVHERTIAHLRSHYAGNEAAQKLIETNESAIKGIKGAYGMA